MVEMSEKSVSRKVHNILHDPSIIIKRFLLTKAARLLPDSTYLRATYRLTFGKPLNLDNPETFNEKLQWLKLHDRRPEYTAMVDKYEAKKYVASIIGEEHIIPTLGVWDRFDDIDISKLPNQFVLKCTHDCGGLVICRDKSSFNAEKARDKIERCLKRNYYWGGREWPYKDVKPRILAEQYMEDEETHELRDYKFFTFDGVPKALFIATERGSKEETKFDFFDADFKHLPFTNGHPNADVMPAKPKTFEEMKSLAAKLSENIPQLRVDFYEVNGKAYFGELTFSHWSGMMPFNPPEWDKTFGEWIKLPEIHGGGYALIHDGYVLWLHQKNIGLTDYKFFCFNGRPNLLYVSRGLEHHPTAEISFYDMNGTEKEYHRSDYKPYHDAMMPSNFGEMKVIAEQLAKEVGCPFVRIDLYSIKGHIYFSEITFSPCSGMIPFEPMNADEELGRELLLTESRGAV